MLIFTMGLHDPFIRLCFVEVPLEMANNTKGALSLNVASELDQIRDGYNLDFVPALPVGSIRAMSLKRAISAIQARRKKWVLVVPDYFARLATRPIFGAVDVPVQKYS